jgi:hypothetical protein
MATTILKCGVQGAMGGIVLGTAAGVAWGCWKRSGVGAAPRAAADKSCARTALDNASLHVDVESALQEMMSGASHVPALAQLIAGMDKIHRLVGSPRPSPEGDGGYRALMGHSTRAQELARQCRDALTELEVLGTCPDFAEHADTIERCLKEDLFNINISVNSAA